MAIKTFTTGELLTASDTNTYLANSGLVYVTSVTVGNAVSTVAVPSAFSATYDNYRIVYSGGTSSTNASLGMTLGAVVAGYFSGLIRVQTATGTVLGLADNSAAKWSYVGYAATSSVALSFDLLNPFAATPTAYHGAGWVLSSDCGTSSGINTSATSYTSFNIIPGSGTLTGGTITVYGYRKA
jgi:hypothetical protein